MGYAFGSFTFDPQVLSLYCHGVALPIKPKTASLLAFFLQHPGELVTKAELMDALWPDADVTEANLTQHVFLMRQIFSAHSPHETFVVTQAAHGYRFVAPVQPIGKEPWRRSGWREYSRGRFYADQRTDASLELGLQYFQRAFAIDARNADALSGIAFCHVLRAEYLLAAPDVLEFGRAAAQKALELDPDHAEAHLAMGDVHVFRDWDPVRAQQSYERALWRNPSSSRVRYFRAWLFGITGEFDRGVHEIEMAIGRDPYSLELQTVLAVLELMRGEFEACVEACDDVLALDPTNAHARFYRRAALAYGGAPREALEAFLNEEPAEHRQQAIGIAGYAAGLCGDTREARRMLAMLTDRRSFAYVSPFNVAHVLLGLGREAEAIVELERGVRERDSWSIFLPSHRILSRVNGMGRVIAKIAPGRGVTAR